MDNKKLYAEIRKGNRKPLGGLCLSNWGGLEVYEINSDEIITGFNFGNGVKDLRHTKLYENTKGFYFIRFKTRYYLSDIMRY